MRYVHSSSPPHAANNNNHCALRSAAMSRPRRHISDSLAKRRKAIKEFDIDCTCKCSLIVSCAIGMEPGCRERRREGTCPCKPRWLPACILDKETPHGCKVWQEGHQCNCDRLYMPRCLVTGCNDRRRGRRCECPRTPTEVCWHVADLSKRFADFTPEKAEAAAAEWARLQRQVDPEKYRDWPLPEAGGNVSLREAAIALMMIRYDGGRALRHPDDYGATTRRRLQQEQQRRMEGMAAGFLALLYAMRRKGGHK